MSYKGVGEDGEGRERGYVGTLPKKDPKMYNMHKYVPRNNTQKQTTTVPGRQRSIDER